MKPNHLAIKSTYRYLENSQEIEYLESFEYIEYFEYIFSIFYHNFLLINNAYPEKSRRSIKNYFKGILKNIKNLFQNYLLLFLFLFVG